MNNYTIALSQKRFSYKHIISVFLFIAGIISLTLNCNIAKAQSTPPSAAGNTSPPDFDNISPREFNNVRPVQQDWDYGSGGSQQFFKQDNDNLYFLPEDEFDSILQIDESVKTEEIENSQDESLNK